MPELNFNWLKIVIAVCGRLSRISLYRNSSLEVHWVNCWEHT